MPGTNAGKRVVAAVEAVRRAGRGRRSARTTRRSTRTSGARSAATGTRRRTRRSRTRGGCRTRSSGSRGREARIGANADDMHGVPSAAVRRRDGADAYVAGLRDGQGEPRPRNYADLGARQGEQASLQGVSQGGTLAASLAARAANQGREQQAADTGLPGERGRSTSRCSAAGRICSGRSGGGTPAQDGGRGDDGDDAAAGGGRSRHGRHARRPRAHQLHAGHGRVAVLPGVSAGDGVAGAAAPGERAGARARTRTASSQSVGAA
jgi:hypothetical protein